LATCSGGKTVKRRRPATQTAMLCDSSKCAGVTMAVPTQMRGSTPASSSDSTLSVLKPGMQRATSALCTATAGARGNCA
jgi:hypothetical protein